MNNFLKWIFTYIFVCSIYMIKLFFSYKVYGWFEIWLYNSIIISLFMSLIITVIVFLLHYILFNHIYKVKDSKKSYYFIILSSISLYLIFEKII